MWVDSKKLFERKSLLFFRKSHRPPDFGHPKEPTVDWGQSKIALVLGWGDSPRLGFGIFALFFGGTGVLGAKPTHLNPFVTLPNPEKSLVNEALYWTIAKGRKRGERRTALDPIYTWLAEALPRFIRVFCAKCWRSGPRGPKRYFSFRFAFVGSGVWAVIAIANFGNEIETNAESGNEVVPKASKCCESLW